MYALHITGPLSQLCNLTWYFHVESGCIKCRPIKNTISSIYVHYDYFELLMFDNVYFCTLLLILPITIKVTVSSKFNSQDFTLPVSFATMRKCSAYLVHLFWVQSCLQWDVYLYITAVLFSFRRNVTDVVQQVHGNGQIIPKILIEPKIQDTTCRRWGR